jgi:hypothetical protein
MTLAAHRTRSASRRSVEAGRPVGAGRPRERAVPVDHLAVRDQLTALLTALAAFWLFIGAWAVGYAETESGGDAYLNESVVGVLLLFLALSRYLRPLRQLFASAGTVLLGAWLVVSPFVWGYAERPYAAAGAPQLEWATGAVVLILGVLGVLWARAARRSGFRPT